MDVNMKMRDFLKRCLTDRVPDAQAFVWEYAADRSSNLCQRHHQGGSRRVINLAHVSEMATRDNERVAGMKLSKIDKGHGQLVFEDDARGNLTPDNIAKNAALCIRVTHRANENSADKIRL